MKKYYGFVGAMLIVIVGISVAAISLYQASMSGLYMKMGFDGSSYASEVDPKAYREVYTNLIGSYGECRYSEHISRSLFLSFDTSVDALRDMRLAEENMLCGVMIVSEGAVKRGVAEIVRAHRYSAKAVEAVRSECAEGGDVCEEVIARRDMIINTTIKLHSVSTGTVREILGGYLES